jgi:DNA-binding MarR family transcriptional regulator
MGRKTKRDSAPKRVASTKATLTKPASPPDRRELQRLRTQVEVSAAKHKALDRSALLLVLAVYRAFSTLDRDLGEEIGRVGLTPTQFNILTTLHRAEEPVTMGELASMLVVRPTNLSGIVGALCDRGLMRREVDSLDQRSVIALLTPAGRRVLEDFLPEHWRYLELLLKGLPETTRASLTKLLKQFTETVVANAAPIATRRVSARARAAEHELD